MSIMKKWTQALAVLLAIAAGIAFFTLSISRPPAPIQETRTIVTSLAIHGVLQPTDVQIPEGTSALAMLKEELGKRRLLIVTKEYTGLGTLVEQIGLYKNGDEDKYWTYMVNGTFANVGADAYVVQNSDSIEWTFSPPPDTY
ncbi:DUF4430 domain-containing protein [Candidatus Kaiserbacteria bacterium]|nr:DUF4430 domain-containing protein [Candidatus Kaiserbacteria bacterium]